MVGAFTSLYFQNSAYEHGLHMVLFEENEYFMLVRINSLDSLDDLHLYSRSRRNELFEKSHKCSNFCLTALRSYASGVFNSFVTLLLVTIQRHKNSTVS